MAKIYKYGIDISKHNGNIDLKPYRNQFVLIRAGYGIKHTDNKFRRNVDECMRLGIPFGVYWYSYAMNVEDAKTEAEYFLKLIAPYRTYIKMGVWLDMEDADDYKRDRGFKFNYANISEICYAWCERVEEAGYYTGIYASESWMDYINPRCERFDKWTASWGTNNGNLQNDMSGYGSLHQYTSKPIDRNVSYVDISRFAINPNRVRPAEDAKPSKLTIDEMARCVINGDYGNGKERRDKLESLGYNYNEVQARVNELLSAASRLSIDEMARRVINGDYGNGRERIDKLTALGYNYDEVQAKVNELLGAVNTNKVYYEVVAGDTLWDIAEKYNTTVDKLVKMNGIENRNLIYVGQVIRVL